MYKNNWQIIKIWCCNNIENSASHEVLVIQYKRKIVLSTSEILKALYQQFSEQQWIN